MKRRIQTLVVALALLLSLAAHAQFTYTITDKAVTITGLDHTVAAIVIPDTVSGFSVTCIGNQALQ